MTSTVKIKNDEIIYFKAFLSSKKDVKLLETKSQYEAFRAKVRGGLIIGYTSGSIVINKEDILSLVNEILIDIRRHKLDFDVVIGSDEAGKGEWLGPLTIAAVALTPNQVLNFQSEGVRDSKLLKTEKIIELSNYIKENSVAFHITSISPRKFNKLFEQFKKEGKSLNNILALGHAKSIENVINKIYSLPNKIRIIIDEFDRIKTDMELRKILDVNKFHIVQKPKAEEEIAVAAASILARAEREFKIETLSKKFNIDLRNIDPINVKIKPYINDIAKVSYLKNKSPKK